MRVSGDGPGSLRLVRADSKRIRVNRLLGPEQVYYTNPAASRRQEGRSPASVTRCITRRKPW